MIKNFIRKYMFFLLPLVLIPEYFTDYFRYLKYSGVLDPKGNRLKLRGKIMAEYHKVEKGLVMINFRKGFGEKKLIVLIDDCLTYIRKYGLEDVQIKQAIAALLEYKEIHKKLGYKLSDNLMAKFELLTPYENGIEASRQFNFNKSTYFRDVESAFPLFSQSRKSIRNYSDEDLNIESIKKAVLLARTAPSVCNRQAARVHVITEKQMIERLLAIQDGAKGFSQVVNRLLIVTADLSGFHGVYERNEAYIDGGLFSMNLLYGLHYNKIAACALNCCFPNKKSRLVRELCNIKDSEVLIMMISCGNAPENFNSTIALRNPLENILTII